MGELQFAEEIDIKKTIYKNLLNLNDDLRKD